MINVQKMVIALVILTILVLGRRFMPTSGPKTTKAPAKGSAPVGSVTKVNPAPVKGVGKAPVGTTPRSGQGMGKEAEQLARRLAEAEAQIEGQGKRIAALYVLNQLMQFDVRARHHEFDVPEGAIGRAGELKARPQGLPRQVGLRIDLSGKASGPMARLPILVERFALYRFYKEVTDGAAPIRIWREELGNLVPCRARKDLEIGSAMLDVSVQGQVHLGADKVRMDLIAWNVADGKELYRVHSDGLYLEELVTKAMRQVARREIQAAKGR